MTADLVFDCLALDLVEQSFLPVTDILLLHRLLGVILQLVQAVEKVLQGCVEINVTATAVIIQRILYIFLSIRCISELDSGHCSTKIDFVGVKLVAEPVGNDSHEIRRLPERRVYLVPFDIVELLDSAKSESTNCPILVHRGDVEHLVDEIRFPQPFVHLCQLIRLSIYLLLGLQLRGKLKLIVIHLLPYLVLLRKYSLLVFVKLRQFLFLK